MSLTDLDRELIAKARELAGVDPEDMCAFTGETDLAMADAVALGRAQHLLRRLADLAEDLAAGGVADVAAWCKGCRHATPSVPCPRCGGPSCAGCGRCPSCDGPLSEEDDNG
jgi:hypothetical protein